MNHPGLRPHNTKGNMNILTQAELLGPTVEAIVHACHENRGMKTELVAFLNERTELKVHRNNVDRWLSLDQKIPYVAGRALKVFAQEKGLA